jgi:PTS system mannitol-specific IIA component
VLDHPALTMAEAILACGEKLVELGAVADGYVDEMLERENRYSTFLGDGVAIPHGSFEARNLIKFDQIVLLRLRGEVDWGSEKVKLVIGLAVRGQNHVELLGSVADLLVKPDQRQLLLDCVDSQEVLNLLAAALLPSAHK